MFVKCLRFTILGIILGMGVLNGYSQENPEDNPLPPSYPVYIYSNGPGFLFSSDGQKTKVSRDGTRFFLQEGWNDLYVGGPRILPQKFKLFYLPNDNLQKYYIALRKATSDAANAKDVDNISSSFSQTTKRPIHLNSSCNKIIASTPPTQRGKLNCDFEHFHEELLAVGPFPNTQVQGVSTASQLFIEHFFHTLLNFKPSVVLGHIGEHVHRITPQGTQGFEIAGFSALLDGHCPRVFELVAELRLLDKPSPILSTYQAICYELVDDKDSANKVYQELASLQEELPSTRAAIYYHRYRWQGKTSLIQAESTLNECRQNFPWFVHCHNRLADIAVVKSQNNHAKNIISSFTAQNERPLDDHTAKVIALRESGKHKAAKELHRSHPLKDTALSLVLLSIYLEYKQKGNIRSLRNALFRSRAISHLAAQRVLEHSGALEKTDSFWEVALKVLIRDIREHRSKHIAMLFDRYHKNNRCAQLDRFHYQIDEEHINPYDEAILDTKVNCAMAQEDHKDRAVEAIIQLHKYFPNSWRPQIRMAELYLSNEEYSQGFCYYRQSVKFAPPEDIFKMVLAKIKALDEAHGPFNANKDCSKEEHKIPER